MPSTSVSTADESRNSSELECLEISANQKSTSRNAFFGLPYIKKINEEKPSETNDISELASKLSLIQSSYKVESSAEKEQPANDSKTNNDEAAEVAMYTSVASSLSYSQVYGDIDKYGVHNSSFSSVESRNEDKHDSRAICDEGREEEEKEENGKDDSVVDGEYDTWVNATPSVIENGDFFFPRATSGVTNTMEYITDKVDHTNVYNNAEVQDLQAKDDSATAKCQHGFGIRVLPVPINEEDSHNKIRVRDLEEKRDNFVSSIPEEIAGSAEQTNPQEDKNISGQPSLNSNEDETVTHDQSDSSSSKNLTAVIEQKSPPGDENISDQPSSTSNEEGKVTHDQNVTSNPENVTTNAEQTSPQEDENKKDHLSSPPTEDRKVTYNDDFVPHPQALFEIDLNGSIGITASKSQCIVKEEKAKKDEEQEVGDVHGEDWQATFDTYDKQEEENDDDNAEGKTGHADKALQREWTDEAFFDIGNESEPLISKKKMKRTTLFQKVKKTSKKMQAFSCLYLKRKLKREKEFDDEKQNSVIDNSECSVNGTEPTSWFPMEPDPQENTWNNTSHSEGDIDGFLAKILTESQPTARSLDFGAHGMLMMDSSDSVLTQASAAQDELSSLQDKDDEGTCLDRKFIQEPDGSILVKASRSYSSLVLGLTDDSKDGIKSLGDNEEKNLDMEAISDTSINDVNNGDGIVLEKVSKSKPEKDETHASEVVTPLKYQQHLLALPYSVDSKSNTNEGFVHVPEGVGTTGGEELEKDIECKQPQPTQSASSTIKENPNDSKAQSPFAIKEGGIVCNDRSVEIVSSHIVNNATTCDEDEVSTGSTKGSNYTPSSIGNNESAIIRETQLSLSATEAKNSSQEYADNLSENCQLRSALLEGTSTIVQSLGGEKYEVVLEVDQIKEMTRSSPKDAFPELAPDNSGDVTKKNSLDESSEIDYFSQVMVHISNHSKRTGLSHAQIVQQINKELMKEVKEIKSDFSDGNSSISDKGSIDETTVATKRDAESIFLSVLERVVLCSPLKDGFQSVLGSGSLASIPESFDESLESTSSTDSYDSLISSSFSEDSASTMLLD